MKNQNKRDLEKRWLEQAKKGAKKPPAAKPAKQDGEQANQAGSRVAPEITGK